MYPRRQLVALGLPGFVWVLLFVAVAIYGLFATSVGTINPLLFQPEPAWSPAHWSFTTLFHVGSGLLPPHGQYWPVVSRTLVYVGLAVMGCVLIGYPVAYFVAIRAKRSKPIILGLLVLPLLVSYMLRMLAWVGLLAPNGYVNQGLNTLGIIGGPVNWLGGRPSTVVFALIYGWVPYFILPLYAALDRLDTRYLEAANDLGANAFKTFLTVTLPLSTQGILAGVVLVGLPMTGDFFTNDLMSGSPRTGMIGNLINVYANSTVEQVTGAALAVWLLIFLTVLLAYYVRSSTRALRTVNA
jgi:ABC-type spermidine/putrescine transport system permease subunit I